MKGKKNTSPFSSLVPRKQPMSMDNSTQHRDDFIVLNNGLIKKIINRRCTGMPEHKEELLSYIYEKLLENDRHRLKLYDASKGAKPVTYLCAVVNRLVSSYFQNHFGRFRPPELLLKQNDFLMILIYKHLCFQKMKQNDLIEYLKNSVSGKRKQCFIEEKINAIKALYPRCGQEQAKEVHMEEAVIPSKEKNQEHFLTASHIFNVFHLIMTTGQKNAAPGKLKTGEPRTDNMPKDKPLHNCELEKIKNKLSCEFNIPPEKQIFLRMIYQDGMSITAAGKQLGWNKNQSTGHHRRLLGKLKSILQGHALL